MAELKNVGCQMLRAQIPKNLFKEFRKKCIDEECFVRDVLIELMKKWVQEK